MDREAGPLRPVIRAQPPEPGDQGRDVVRPVAGRDHAAEPDEGMPAGFRWPYQVRRRPIATSTLTTGSSR